jgi:hypothetical protein
MWSMGLFVLFTAMKEMNLSGMFMRKIPKLHVATMIYSTLKTGTDKD